MDQQYRCSVSLRGWHLLIHEQQLKPLPIPSAVAWGSWINGFDFLCMGAARFEEIRG